MKPTLYVRKNHILKPTPAGEDEGLEQIKCDSINAAKRKSRELQMKHDSALGLGSVMKATK